MSDNEELPLIQESDIRTVVDKLPTATIAKSVLKLLFKRQYKQRTDAWLQKRKGILTASDCAAALGLNKHQTRSQLILKKSGLNPPSKGGDAMMHAACEHGIKYEDEAADIYMHKNPHLAPFFELGLIMHDQHTFLGASPDRVTKDGILIEIKYAGF
jgi:putative phage-type endonuclease